MSDFFRSYIIPVALVALIAALGMGIAKQARQGYALYSDVGEMEERVEELEKQNEELRDIIASFDDIETIDREVRNRLNLKKEGENVVIILPPEDASVTEAEEEVVEEEASFWQKLGMWVANLTNFRR